MKKLSPHPIDLHVGGRLKTLRKLRKMSQSKLGDQIGLTFQQIQKYEHGANRVGASRLHELSQILDVPVSYFFDDMPDTIQRKPTPESVQALPETDPYDSADVQELLQAFNMISQKKKRHAICKMAKALSNTDKIKEY
ncbi:MAG: helix-turn-helix domain-containing protein [Alphaproteobacteria bacterium]|nr:helix-turn-helix domain-containing protein [Alphaproteobacteria bacterium]